MIYRFFKQSVVGAVFVFTLDCSAQDIVSVDGHNFGPKSNFVRVCTSNMKPDTLNGEALYNVVNFCNCVALDLLPTLTKVKINYYFTEGHLAELFADNEVILTNCVLYGKDQPMQGPPPQEILVPERK